ncbi:nucleoside recognition domain-containing protein [Bacillus licheniformis]|uniref:nucleoside recognition domain-containing protein n=1 Tax=Bacillus licheniformis TaxID=1402 RepID=UPI002DB7FA49|nr:nucleoside recognition domain-containing protein [Bacillus licheniformis]MEC1865298.1 nucleoside recognition domain-containing protein [Bacillus licheniformis]
MLKEPTRRQRMLFIGLESVGKTTLFSAITDQRAGEAANVKGSTIFAAEREIKSLPGWQAIDTPGIREDGSVSKRALKKEIEKADEVVAVLRGTHFSEELNAVLELIPPEARRVCFIVTFQDKMTDAMRRKLSEQVAKHSLPVLLVDTRTLTDDKKERIIAFLRKEAEFHPLKRRRMKQIELESVAVQQSVFHRPVAGPVVSAALLCLLFMAPIVLAYHTSEWVQQSADKWAVVPLQNAVGGLPSWLGAALAGNYGLLSLGIYSFVWAFPVVLFMSIANAAADDSGLKDRIVDSLDPLMRKIGLNGRDLVPLLTGFGCNVVAVQQTRSCSMCTRKRCVSFISFGSACSYQIGATLSIFHAAGREWLFIPYLAVLVAAAAVHNRIWYRIDQKWAAYFERRQTFLQKPSWKGIVFRVKEVLQQFIFQAMPIFLIICLAATVLNELGVIRLVTLLVSPVLSLFGAPEDAAPGLVFSLIRKDGILLFNEGNGALLDMLPGATLFLLIYLASTFTPCMVTVWTIAKELGMKTAAAIMGKQMATSVVSVLSIMIIWKLTLCIFK